MKTIERNISFGGLLIAFTIILNGVVLSWALTTNSDWYWALSLTVPMLFITLLNAGRDETPPKDNNGMRRSRKQKRMRDTVCNEQRDHSKPSN